MAEHHVLFEVFYDGAWHQAPVLDRDTLRYMRGTATVGNDTDPADATLTLDNALSLYSPRSVASPLYSKIGQNTPGRITIDGDALIALDRFDDRSFSGAWGLTRTGPGGGWSLAWNAGSASNFSVSGGAGLMAVTAAAAYSMAFLGDLHTDAPDVYLTGVTLPLATGGDLETGPLLAGDGNTYYMLRAVIKTTNAIDLKIINVVDLAETTLVTVSSGLTHAAATPLNFRGQIRGGVVRFKAWQGSVEPFTWQAEAAATVVRRGWVGVRSGRGAGNTNTVTPQFSYDSVSVSAGGTRISGEIANWKPRRPIKGSGDTPIELAGVLLRIGSGTDKFQSPMRRSFDNDPVQAVAYWPLEEVKGSATAYDTVNNLPSAVGGFTSLVTGNAGAPQFGVVDAGIGSAPIANIAGGWNLDLNLPVVAATGQVTYQFTTAYGTTVRNVGVSTHGIRLDPTFAAKHLQWSIGVFDDGKVNLRWLEADAALNLLAGPTEVYAAGSGTRNIFDGRPRVFQLNLAASGGTNVAWTLYENDVALASGTVTPSFSGAMSARPWRASAISTVSADVLAGWGHVGVWTSNFAPTRTVPLAAHDGETSADRFERLCDEEGITPTIVGNPFETVAMGPQGTDPFLDQLDEIARTDDASIFETRDDLGLTMRTGASKLNQDPALTVSYLGQIEPPLIPVFGGEGIRNDVEARNPDGVTRRVQQLTGPHNVQPPGDDPQGVGRYKTSVAVNTATVDDLTGAAGWRVNLGTFDGTWYATVTVDLDAAPGLTATVNAVDIGDVVAISELPVDEALDTVDGLVIGISEDLPPKRRLVTFHLVPAEPYRVGVLANTTGDTDPLVGREAETTETSSTTTGAVAAGATSFTVATPTGPLWTVDADDFPLDVIAGGQRVSISSITGASSPQTFNVQTTGRQVRYAIPSGSPVKVQQPIILAL